MTALSSSEIHPSGTRGAVRRRTGRRSGRRRLPARLRSPKPPPVRSPFSRTRDTCRCCARHAPPPSSCRADFAETIAPASDPRRESDESLRAGRAAASRRSRFSFAPGIHPTRGRCQRMRSSARAFPFNPTPSSSADATIGDDTVIGADSYVGHEIDDRCRLPDLSARHHSRANVHRSARHHSQRRGHRRRWLWVRSRARADTKKFRRSGLCKSMTTWRSAPTPRSIARASVGPGFKQGVKIDNLVQIAHNVVVGQHSIIAAQAGIAGSSRVGDHVMIGGQVGVTGHVEIGDRNIIGAQNGVSKNLPRMGAPGGALRLTPLA